MRRAAVPGRIRSARRPPLSRGFWAAAAAAALVVVLAAVTATPVSRSRDFSLMGETISHLDTQDKVVALTFDDGPDDAWRQILPMLADRGVRVTFFLNGMYMRSHPEVTPRLITAGHQIGNHTWSHRHMLAMTQGQIAQEIVSTDELIRRAGYRGRIAFRPPYGQKLVALPFYLATHNRLSVLWNSEPEDFHHKGQTVDQMVDAALHQIRPGSIIVMHPWFDRWKTRAAAARVIDELQARGYRFATVNELTQLRDG